MYLSKRIVFVNKNNTIGYSTATDRKRLNFIIEQLNVGIPSGGRVLDIGCGNGIISIELGRLKYQVHGIDISEKAIAKAQAINTLNNVKFDVKDAETLISENQLYDAIICSEVLEHLRDPAHLLQSLHKILKRDGKLIVTVPNGRGPRETLVTKPTLKLRKQNSWAWRVLFKLKKGLGYSGYTVQSDAEDLDHVQFFSKEDLSRLSLNNNFVITSFNNSNFVEDVFPFSLLTKRIYTLQKLDCRLADYLPHSWTGGFNMVWVKRLSKQEDELRI